jgi:hypothetical protein
LRGLRRRVGGLSVGDGVKGRQRQRQRAKCRGSCVHFAVGVDAMVFDTADDESVH